MTTELQDDQPNLYETDYLKWIETTIEKLRDHNYASVDWENLIEEIEDMGRSERRSLESNLVVILLHLLKWQYQPSARSNSWKASLVEHRRRVRNALRESPSLKPYLQKVFDQGYWDAIEQAVAETGLPMEIVPPNCPYTVTEVLDPHFLPE